MTLYEINREIEDLIDPETGEITDIDKFNSLFNSREAKVENIALYIKNLKAEATAYKAEKDVFAQRERVAKNRADRLVEYLSNELNGQRFSTDKVAISYRRSISTVVDDDFLNWARENGDEYLSYKDPDVNLTAIKTAINSGVEVPHAQLVEKNNIQIR